MCECFKACQKRQTQDINSNEAGCDEIFNKGGGTNLSTTRIANRHTQNKLGSRNDNQHKMYVKTCKDMPVRMKNAHAVNFNNAVHIGGGYTRNSTQDSMIYTQNPCTDTWNVLPQCPLKWFAMAVFNSSLLLIGGKEITSRILEYTNKVAIWNENDSNWTFSFPPMRNARISPVVISKKNYLIVAGGLKGSLDYNVEVFDLTNNQWFAAPSLPFKCFVHTSAVIGDTWYLMSDSGNELFHADIPSIIKQARSDKPVDANQPVSTSISGLWQHVLIRTQTKPFRIVCFGMYLLAFSLQNNVLSVYAYSSTSNGSHGGWEPLGKLPELCSNASSLSDSSKQQLYLFGGDGANKQYSQKVFKVCLTTEVEEKSLKQERHVSINS